MTKKSKVVLKPKQPIVFKDEFHKWNYLLIQNGLKSVAPQKPTEKEFYEQRKSKRKGLPNWAKGKH